MTCSSRSALASRTHNEALQAAAKTGPRLRLLKLLVR